MASRWRPRPWIWPRSNKQLNKIFNAYAPTDGYAVVRPITSGAAFYCYGSVLDNTLSDPTTITPELQWRGRDSRSNGRVFPARFFCVPFSVWMPGWREMTGLAAGLALDSLTWK